jgi:hypothetical protein
LITDSFATPEYAYLSKGKDWLAHKHFRPLPQSEQDLGNWQTSTSKYNMQDEEQALFRAERAQHCIDAECCMALILDLLLYGTRILG